MPLFVAAEKGHVECLHLVGPPLLLSCRVIVGVRVRVGVGLGSGQCQGIGWREVRRQCTKVFLCRYFSWVRMGGIYFRARDTDNVRDFLIKLG